MRMQTTRFLVAAFILTVICLPGCTGSKEQSTEENLSKENVAMGVMKEAFGTTPDDKEVDQYTLTNDNGLTVKVITLGAVITDVIVPDRDGKMDNIVLNCDTVEDYLTKSPYFGAIVGRYGNRIAAGKFTLDGEDYTLAVNNGDNHLHGGLVGFDKIVWSAEPIEVDGVVGVKLSMVSPDGDEGYPGTLNLTCEYTLNNDNELKMDYTGTTDKATPVNVTNHSYWNLSGAGSGTILDDEVTLNAPYFLPTDQGLIPTGELQSVEGTTMDFTTMHTIGERIEDVIGGYDLETGAGGYDHAFVLDREGVADGELAACAEIRDPKTGRTMTITTTEPAVQFYSGNFLDGTNTTSEFTFDRHNAFCMETEHYPDSPNQSDFPTTILKPGETYRHTTVHTFGTDKSDTTQ